MPLQDTDDEKAFADWIYDNYTNPSHHDNAIYCSPDKWNSYVHLMNVILLCLEKIHKKNSKNI